MQITTDIFQIGGGELSAVEDAAVYLILAKGHAAVVDAGCGRSVGRLADNIAAAAHGPVKIAYILLTHCHYDHTGGAAALRDKLGGRIVAHALDACFLENGDDRATAAGWYGAHLPPFKVDHHLKGPENELPLGDHVIRAIHIPGHSPGSVAYLVESDGVKVLFGQDIHGPLHPDLLSDPRAYRDSLKRLIALEADILCEGHFGVFRGKQEVAAFIQSYL